MAPQGRPAYADGAASGLIQLPSARSAAWSGPDRAERGSGEGVRRRGAQRLGPRSRCPARWRRASPIHACIDAAVSELLDGIGRLGDAAAVPVLVGFAIQPATRAIPRSYPRPIHLDDTVANALAALPDGAEGALKRRGLPAVGRGRARRGERQALPRQSIGQSRMPSATSPRRAAATRRRRTRPPAAGRGHVDGRPGGRPWRSRRWRIPPVLRPPWRVAWHLTGLRAATTPRPSPPSSPCSPTVDVPRALQLAILDVHAGGPSERRSSTRCGSWRSRPPPTPSCAARPCWPSVVPCMRRASTPCASSCAHRATPMCAPAPRRSPCHRRGAGAHHGARHPPSPVVRWELRRRDALPWARTRRSPPRDRACSDADPAVRIRADQLLSEQVCCATGAAREGDARQLGAMTAAIEPADPEVLAALGPGEPRARRPPFAGGWHRRQGTGERSMTVFSGARWSTPMYAPIYVSLDPAAPPSRPFGHG